MFLPMLRHSIIPTVLCCFWEVIIFRYWLIMYIPNERPWFPQYHKHMILRESWPVIWYIISQYRRIITSQKQHKTVGIILCRNIGKNMLSLRHHQLCKENEVCVTVYSMLPVGIMFRGPQCFKKTLVCRVVGGVHVDVMWPMAYYCNRLPPLHAIITSNTEAKSVAPPWTGGTSIHNTDILPVCNDNPT